MLGNIDAEFASLAKGLGDGQRSVYGPARTNTTSTTGNQHHST